MVFFEDFQIIPHFWELLLFYERGADAQTFFVAACRIEGDGADAVKQKFPHQIAPFYTRIRHGKVKTVCNFFSQIVVVG